MTFCHTNPKWNRPAPSIYQPYEKRLGRPVHSSLFFDVSLYSTALKNLEATSSRENSIKHFILNTMGQDSNDPNRGRLDACCDFGLDTIQPRKEKRPQLPSE
ncbi:hypothetical protein OUZ56_022649 [Daphnia magna]|uniref:Uncharacterized protein n=1 Tax=Daphnia magna TaxID=35525 RepID=A0ABR0AX21_9CRUS|nr:hypothetical protein OUZ56_022649 [Daphnia magna]